MKDIIYKYIGLDSETRRQTVIATLTAIIDFLTAFHIIEFTDEQVQAVYKLGLCLVTAFVWGYCSHWKNNNFSPEMVTATITAREAKAKRLLPMEDAEEPEDSYEAESEVIPDEI